MLQTLLIAFREGLEALLIVAIAALYLRKTGRPQLVSAIRAGVVTALVFSAVVGVILAQVGAMSPAWEGLLALVAAAAVISCTVHMLRMGRHMKKHIDTQLSQATAQPGGAGWWAVFAFALFMVGREGVETATMIASLAGSAELGHMAWGGAIGFALAAWISWLWTRHGHKVNLSRFFQVTAVFMVVFSLQLVLHGFHEFTEAALVPGIDNAWWHAATEDLAEGNVAQLISVLMVGLPSIWLVGAFWKDRRDSRATAG
ncbi:FTR1 family iron permease [Caenimonas aquaedulcis]|uniref:FTR1 family protein n=1 Tax=Caenimonas aquaedulcis TaxID=2793270 RepID=A0A931H2B6_9BURK|nr:FTR1 family protein [Caenimonas aquaedulcis]MBG9387309.1 FTR1 family protein [Caenimonas aquaedulcis]